MQLSVRVEGVVGRVASLMALVLFSMTMMGAMPGSGARKNQRRKGRQKNMRRRAKGGIKSQENAAVALSGRVQERRGVMIRMMMRVCRRLIVKLKVMMAAVAKVAVMAARL